MTLKAIKERIEKILAAQKNFEAMTLKMQDEFLKLVLLNLKNIATDTFAFEGFYAQFQADYYTPLIKSLAGDLLEIVNSNEVYFKAEVPGREAEILATAQKIAQSFGFSLSGEVSPIGYLADLAKDTSVKRTFKSQLIKLYGQDLPASKTAKEISDFINGTDETLGVWESFFSKPDMSNVSVFDIYQKADRYAQNEFASDLGLQAAIYVGGLIDGSRQFCKDRSGKIFLKEEIAAWANLSFAGKPKTGYDPFTDLGGYRCRHHLSWIGPATAMRLDKTLTLSENRLVRNAA